MAEMKNATKPRASESSRAFDERLIVDFRAEICARACEILCWSEQMRKQTKSDGMASTSLNGDRTEFWSRSTYTCSSIGIRQTAGINDS